MRSATTDWQKQVDHLRRFVEEVLIFEPSSRVQAASMHRNYTSWCRQNGEQPLSMRDFKNRLLEGLDLTHSRISGRGWWKGVKLKA